MRSWAWPVGFAAVAVAARLPGAIRDSFWQDEVASARVMLEPSFGGMLGHVRATEATPPAWYALGWLLHQIGLSPYGYRLFGLLFAAALAAGTWLLARFPLDRGAAALATAAVVFGYQFVFHGRELRAYEAYAALAVVFAFLLLRSAGEPSRGRLAALWLVVALGCLTNYFFLLFVLAGLVWLWLPGNRLEPARWRSSSAVLLGLVPFLAWLPSLLDQYRHQHFSWIGAFDAQRVVSAYWLLLARSDPRTPVLHSLAPYLTAALVLAGAVWLTRRSPVGRLVALLAVAPVAAAGLVWAAGPEIFDPRNVLGAGPFAAIAAAGLLPRVSLRILAPAASAAAVGLLLYGYVTSESTPPTDYQAVAHDLVRDGWTPRDPILLYGGNFFAFRSPLEWYLPDRPDLTLGRPTGRACSRAYVLAVGGTRARRLATRLRWTEARQTTNVTTALLPRPLRPASPRRYGLHLLTAVAGRSACLDPVAESRLRAG